VSQAALITTPTADLPSSVARTGPTAADVDECLVLDRTWHWFPLEIFDQPATSWPDPTLPPVTSFNATQDAIWAALDAG
jgi:hypothetical protein